MPNRSIIARLDIGRDQIEAIIAAEIANMKDETDGSFTGEDIAAVAEYATDEILDLIVAADEKRKSL